MKKSVSYKVDLSLDSMHVVQEAECECSVGQDQQHTANMLRAFCMQYYALPATGQLLQNKHARRFDLVKIKLVKFFRMDPRCWLHEMQYTKHSFL